MTNSERFSHKCLFWVHTLLINYAPKIISAPVSEPTTPHPHLCKLVVHVHQAKEVINIERFFMPQG